MLKLSTYSLKSQFQNLLNPIRDQLIKQNISPNFITLFTCFLCIAYSLLLVWTHSTILLIGVPFFLFLRMALNALDGMVAKQGKKQTALGNVLNESCDIISDFFLFGAFIYLLPTSAELWITLITLIVLLEFISLALFQAISIRPFTGPFGKSDRALFLSVIAITLLFFPNAESAFYTLNIIGIILVFITISNRLKFLPKH